VLAAGDDLNIAQSILNLPRDTVFAGESIHERTKPDTLHVTAKRDPYRVLAMLRLVQSAQPTDVRAACFSSHWLSR